jgi:hypothetical protein
MRLKTKKGCRKRCDKTVSSGDTHKSILYQLKSVESKYKFSKAEAPKKSAFKSLAISIKANPLLSLNQPRREIWTIKYKRTHPKTKI